MAQKQLMINDLKLTYKGVFDLDDLFDTIWKSVEQKGYSKHQKKFEEFADANGKRLFVELRPIKRMTAFYLLMIKMRINITGAKPVTIEVDGNPRNMYEGTIEISFDAWTTTDYNKRWGNNPYFFFLKAVINKYIYKFPLEDSLPGQVAIDTRYVYNEVKSHLNLYRYRINE